MLDITPCPGQEGDLQPLSLGPGRRLGGAGGRLHLGQEGVAGRLELVCLAKSRKGEVRHGVQVSWRKGCNTTLEEEEKEEGKKKDREGVVHLTAGERSAVTLECPSPGEGPSLVQWRRGQEPVIRCVQCSSREGGHSPPLHSWYSGYSLEMPRHCGEHYGLFTTDFGVFATSPSCKVLPCTTLPPWPGQTGS